MNTRLHNSNRKRTGMLPNMRDGLVYLKDHSGLMMIWPALCAVLCGVIWFSTFATIDSEKKEALQEASELAVSLSKAYSEQLTRTIEQIDLLTLNVKYYHENGVPLNLEDQLMKGLYPPASELYVTIIDRDGVGRISTLGGPLTNVNDRDYFRFHQTTPDTQLRIDPSMRIGKRSGRKVIRFTRRLNLADGTFDGVVAVAVDPRFMASFGDEASLNPRDFVSIRHDDGTLLVSEKGKDIRGEEVHREPPFFPTASGVMRVSAEKYKDNEARIVAWHRLPGYPLVSYVGLSESGLLANQMETAASYRQIAYSASAFLILLTMVGMMFSLRLALRKKQAEEVRTTYHLAIDGAREGFYMARAIHDQWGKVDDFLLEDCNERGAAMVGRPKKELLGQAISHIHLGQNTQQVLRIYRRAMEVGFLEDEFQVQRDGEAPIWYQRRLVRSQGGLAITLRDISETKQNESLLMKMANTDSLTGFPNRHWLMSFLPTLLASAKDNRQSFAVMFIDLDDFKNINDTLGHSAGDTLLRMAALRLQSVLRPDDFVIRWGGDEFTVILNDLDDRDDASIAAARITEMFRQSFDIGDKKMSVGTSIGISLFPQDGDDTDALIQKADIAMYAAKAEGKGTFYFYDAQLYERIKTRLDMEAELALAIADAQFEMYYQPRVSALTGELTGLEALVRWKHAERGMIPPDEFIPLAESNGSIVQLGALILEKVCAQLAQWRAQHEMLVPVSVNISACQLNMGGIDGLVSSLLRRYDLPVNLLEIELTESAMMSESKDVINQTAAINRLGVRIHLDDFGTGYSSLSRLQEFNMQVLKVDRAFTAKLGTNKEANVLFKTIVLMAKALNMHVIAEGVETDAQLDILRSFSCDEIQGYLVSRPVPSIDVPGMFRKRFLLAPPEYA